MHSRIILFMIALLAAVTIAAACGNGSIVETSTGTAAGTTSTTADTATSGTSPDEIDEHLGDGSLGVVSVETGDAIQIRSLEAITGDVAFFGLPIERSTVLAIEDYGQIHGFDVDLGNNA